MSDRELLELAAKAAGIEIAWKKWVIDPKARTLGGCCFALVGTYTYWNPLDDDGDALRLAVKLQLLGGEDFCLVMAMHESGDPCAATRRAITRAAAEIGRNIK